MTASTLACAPSGSAHLLVVGLVLSQDLLTHLLLSLVDVRIQLVSVLTDGELLVVVNWNEDLLCANWLLVWVVELSHVRMLQCLLCGQTFPWVELQKILQEINSVIRGRWEHVSQLLWFGSG